jgi:hypothetical protein
LIIMLQWLNPLVKILIAYVNGQMTGVSFTKCYRISKGQYKNRQSRETGNIGFTRRRHTKQKNTTQYMLDTTIRHQTQIM